MSEQYQMKSLVVIQASIEDVAILLPSSAVAEVVDYTQPILEVAEAQPDWFLGQLDWRGLKIPLISLEALNHDVQVNSLANAQAKIVVVHFSQCGHENPYWAFVSGNTPRMHRLEPNELEATEAIIEGSQAAAMWALLNNEPHLLVDLAYVEQQIKQLA